MIDRIPGMDWVPAWWLGAMHPFGKNPRHPGPFTPKLLVAHCGDRRPELADYIRDPVEKKPKKPHAQGSPVLCRDGKWRRQVGVHSSWTLLNGPPRLVQQLPMTLEGWGTGVASWTNPDTGITVCAQRIAYHMEWPGPPDQDRTGEQIDQGRRFAQVCKEQGCTHWVRHSHLDSAKHDPGPGVPDDWCDGILLRGF